MVVTSLKVNGYSVSGYHEPIRFDYYVAFTVLFYYVDFLLCATIYSINYLFIVMINDVNST